MLLEQRHRFFQAFESLEQNLEQPSVQEGHLVTDTDLILLKRVREETQRTFGVSFTVLLRFMTEKLPSLSERALRHGPLLLIRIRKPFRYPTCSLFPQMCKEEMPISLLLKNACRTGKRT